jgi:DivIVA domain-containing protein
VAISFSRPDPSSPASVADATFGTGRRGFDQQEVRDFLRMVAAELARLQERERFLERELRTAQASAVPATGGPLDDDTATRLLGEEAARVLQAAREGGASIRARAEDGAAQLLREAGDDARRMREEAELEAGRRRADAAADAEAELAMAKQQGREMVEEARAYRERVLGELSRRRELARQQIEQLIHGRDRLLQAFERARLVAVDVVAELSPLGEPLEYVDLTPTTGPVPIMVPASSIGDASAVDVIGTPTEEETAETAEAQETHGVVDEIEDDDVTATDVDALFARLRAVPPTEPESMAEDAAPEDVTETPFGARNAALTPLIVAAGRKLKRVLADEQNGALDALRRNTPVHHLDALVPWAGEQVARYTDAIAAEMIAAVEAGAASVGATGDIDVGPDGPLAPVRAHVLGELVAPLRERLERAVADGDRDNEVIARAARGVYREWKTQRIDEQLDDLFRLAWCQGALAGLGPGALVQWVVDPDGPPSPDCEDNALAGPVTTGDAFPSGHVTPPMHPGCRCLLVPVDS